jgi:hypothetical protein
MRRFTRPFLLRRRRRGLLARHGRDSRRQTRGEDSSIRSRLRGRSSRVDPERGNWWRDSLTIDLDSGARQGGMFRQLTPMVNWHLSDHVTIEIAYGSLDRFNIVGRTHFFQNRLQVQL